MRKLLVLVTTALLVGASPISTLRAAPLPTMLGVNLIDLMMQYTGTASGQAGSPGAQAAQIAAARKRLADAADQGFSVARVGVMGWGPDDPQDVANPGGNHLTLWLTDPDQFWADMDLMFADLDANGIRLIPMFVWNEHQLPSITGEKVTDLLDWPLKSRALLTSFVTQFITRYKGRSTILFYELFNELNLDADFDSLGYCKQSVYPADQSRCASYADFSSSEMTAFANNFARQVRRLDSTRKISSGYGFPRPSAWHLWHAWASGGSANAWTADTYGEWQEYMAFIHKPFEIVSAHVYPDSTDSWFGREPSQTPQQVDDTTTFAHQNGKLAYIGEFGDPGSPGVTPWLQSVTSIMASDRTDFATLWTWEWYQFAPYVRGSAPNYEPGYTDAANGFFRQLIGAPLPQASVRAVLMWPQPCDTVAKGAGAIGYALASSSAGIDGVTFSLNGLSIGTVAAPPFQVALPDLAPGTYTLTATAVSAAGTVSSTITFGYGQAPQGCIIPSVTSAAAAMTSQTIRTASLGQLRGTARALPAAAATEQAPASVEAPAAVAAQSPASMPKLAGAAPATSAPPPSGGQMTALQLDMPASADVVMDHAVSASRSELPSDPDRGAAGSEAGAPPTPAMTVWGSSGSAVAFASVERHASCDRSRPGATRRCRGAALTSVRWTGQGG